MMVTPKTTTVKLGVQATSSEEACAWKVCLLSNLDKTLTNLTAEKSTSGVQVMVWPSSGADEIGEWLESNTDAVSQWLDNKQNDVLKALSMDVETQASDSDSDLPDL